MAFNHENLKVYQRTLIFNVKVQAWTEQWDNIHDPFDDRRHSTMRRSTKLTTRFPTKGLFIR